MDQEPATIRENKGKFETQPPVEPTPRPVVSQQPSLQHFAPTSKSPRVSGVTAYILSVFSGLIVLCTFAYLVNTVLRHFFIKQEESLFFFDLSVITLYSVITLFVFGGTYFLSLRRVEQGKDDELYGLRKRHEAISAVWQALLAISILGGIVTLIYSPINATLLSPGEKNIGAEITVSIVSTLFAMVLSGLFLWRDRLLHKRSSTLIPTLASLVLILAVIAASFFSFSAKSTPSTPDYSPYQTGGATNYSSLQEQSSDTAQMAYALSVEKKAEAYFAINNTYPKLVADFAATSESKLDESSEYMIIDQEPVVSKEIQYKYCSASSAKIVYLNASGSLTTKQIGDSTNC